MKVHWPILFLVLAGATFGADWQAALSLSDGSRLVGLPAGKGLAVQATGVGSMEIPWDRIRSIQGTGDHENVTIQLLNRDRVQARLTSQSLILQTLFGQRSVPVSLIRHAQFREAGGRDVTWEVLPIAPRDFDSRSMAPAKLDDGEVTLDGWQVRSRRTFSRPVTFECLATLKKVPANAAALTLRFVPADEPRDSIPTRAVTLMLGHRADGRQYITITRNDAPPVILYEEIGKLNVGEPYALSVRWDDERIRVQLNDRTFITRAITAWYDRFHIDLTAGQYGDQWQVTDCLVRTQ